MNCFPHPWGCSHERAHERGSLSPASAGGAVADRAGPRMCGGVPLRLAPRAVMTLCSLRRRRLHLQARRVREGPPVYGCMADRCGCCTVAHAGLVHGLADGRSLSVLEGRLYVTEPCKASRPRPVLDLPHVRGCVRVCSAFQWGRGSAGPRLRIGGPQPPSSLPGKEPGRSRHPAAPYADRGHPALHDRAGLARPVRSCGPGRFILGVPSPSGPEVIG